MNGVYQGFFIVLQLVWILLVPLIWLVCRWWERGRPVAESPEQSSRVEVTAPPTYPKLWPHDMEGNDGEHR